jgi:hypothetical protein
MQAPPNRPKFFKQCGPCQLRVELIGPELWHGAVYEAVPTAVTIPPEHGGEIALSARVSWDRFTCLGKETGATFAKADALATAKKRLGNHANRDVENPGVERYENFSGAPHL